MKTVPQNRRYYPEAFLVAALGLCLCGSLVYGVLGISADRAALEKRAWEVPAGRAPVPGGFLEHVKGAANREIKLQDYIGHQLFASELRVVAMGSEYPIPYDAQVCPFSGIPQPSLAQMDRDADGITDDWELRFGLDKTQKADASADPDEDGFNNLEEFGSGTDPLNASSHPLYAHKLRFVEEKKESFPLIFQGYTELADGNTVFQLSAVGSGKSHFPSIGDEVEGVLVKRFVEGEIGEVPRLYVERGCHEIELVRGQIVADPEKRAELINILDRSAIMVTMGALLSLHSDEYTVLGVYHDKVVVRHLESGEVLDIVSLADGER